MPKSIKEGAQGVADQGAISEEPKLALWKGANLPYNGCKTANSAPKFEPKMNLKEYLKLASGAMN